MDDKDSTSSAVNDSDDDKGNGYEQNISDSSDLDENDTGSQQHRNSGDGSESEDENVDRAAVDRKENEDENDGSIRNNAVQNIFSDDGEKHAIIVMRGVFMIAVVMIAVTTDSVTARMICCAFLGSVCGGTISAAFLENYEDYKEREVEKGKTQQKGISRDATYGKHKGEGEGVATTLNDATAEPGQELNNQSQENSK